MRPRATEVMADQEERHACAAPIASNASWRSDWQYSATLDWQSAGLCVWNILPDLDGNHSPPMKFLYVCMRDFYQLNAAGQAKNDILFASKLGERGTMGSFFWVPASLKHMIINAIYEDTRPEQLVNKKQIKKLALLLNLAVLYR
jgi:hypothetical protein